MSDSVIRRLRYTPMKDLVRGRISGRLDALVVIEASGLPTEAKEVVLRVVTRTRLWLSEKVEVAEELIAHFADGIESGRSVEELLEKFGDAHKAAKLIRRAKKRNRPLAWHVLRAVGWMMAGMLVIYGFFAMRFLLGHPTPSIDYLAILNRPALAAPEEQRGWPIYREAILGLGSRISSKERDDQLVKIFDARPGSEHWRKVGPWLAEHARVLELTRDAARKPHLGFIYGRNGSINDEELWPAKGTEHWYVHSSTEQAVISVPLPQRNDLRELAEAVAADARFARQQGDAVRVMADIEALVKLSEQLHRDSGFVVVDMVALAIWEVGLQAAGDALQDEKLTLSQGDLQKLAHLLSRPNLAADLLDLDGDRWMIHDVIQRCYTDDGKGNGHLTLEGQKYLKAIGAMAPNQSDSTDRVLMDAANSVLTVAIGTSRKDVLEQYDRMMDVAQANLRRPLRQASWTQFQQQALSERSLLNQVRRPVSSLIVYHLGYAQNQAERYLGHRDGIVVGIALQLYRRKHGEYPSTLDVLVPEYLPQVPQDRFNGEAVKYKLVGGRPLIYSVGADQDDDGGRIPLGKNAQFEAANLFVSKEKAVDGDWVLYPQVNDEDR